MFSFPGLVPHSFVSDPLAGFRDAVPVSERDPVVRRPLLPPRSCRSRLFAFASEEAGVCLLTLLFPCVRGVFGLQPRWLCSDCEQPRG